jgi:hypothetical protein
MQVDHLVQLIPPLLIMELLGRQLQMEDTARQSSLGAVIGIQTEALVQQVEILVLHCSDNKRRILEWNFVDRN